MTRNSLIGFGLIGVILLAVACAPAPAPTPVPPTATSKPLPTPAGVLIASHAPGVDHQAKPKRLEAVVEIDMYEFSMDNARGEKNPVFRLPAGKTVGLHVHNEGKILHELVIGRGTIKYEEVGGKKQPAGYETNLFEEVDADLFFYYGTEKIEVEEAKFGEIAVPAGARDLWIRFQVPADLKGEWEIGCFVEGHYEAGMKAKLVIE
jgi:uncharacterized cupredoxin-like copper-binding protein